MTIKNTPLKDCFVLEPRVFKDERGYFIETYNELTFRTNTGLELTFVQDNQSMSSKGVLRGLHFQIGEFAQAKLVRVCKGKVLDVVVDMRSESPSFGQHFSIVLDDIDQKQLFVPRGFAHGFVVLEDDTIFSYKCDNFYSGEHERGVHYSSPSLNIDWGVSTDSLIVSEKDKKLPTFTEYFN